MSAIDRIREEIAQLRQPQPYVGSHTPIASRSVIQIGVDDAEALCDLADAARKGTTREQATNPYDECVSCRDYVDDCRCPLSDVRAALARLDGDAEGGAS